MPQNNHLVRAWLPGPFKQQRWQGGEVIKKEDYSVFANVSQNGKPQAGECISFISSSPSQEGGSGCRPFCLLTVTKRVKVTEADVVQTEN